MEAGGHILAAVRSLEAAHNLEEVRKLHSLAEVHNLAEVHTLAVAHNLEVDSPEAVHSHREEVRHIREEVVLHNRMLMEVGTLQASHILETQEVPHTLPQQPAQLTGCASSYVAWLQDLALKPRLSVQRQALGSLLLEADSVGALRAGFPVVPVACARQPATRQKWNPCLDRAYSQEHGPATTRVEPKAAHLWESNLS